MDNNDALSVSSMNTLILWNVSKAVEGNPNIDLKSALKAAQTRLEQNAHDVKAIISQYPEERHLACALLAWQQLGHSDADSLYRFIIDKGANKPSETLSKDTSIIDKFDIPLSTTNYETPQRSKCFDTSSLGPVIKLPVETKIVMRMDGIGCPQSRSKSSRPRTPERSHIKDKIKKACCLEPGCALQLAALDNMNTELSDRARKLASREAERVRLLERAEAAWRDLEISYQRRLTLAEEKEGDITKQINKIIEERQNYKAACLTLAESLKRKSDAAEKETVALNQVEKQVCDKACIRLSLMESAMKEDANACDAQCKAAQLDRDLQFKEEQARRKVQNLKSELDSSRTLTFEAERAMRAELTGLREHINEVSKQLLADDSDNAIILKTLEELRSEKMEIVEDLEGCKDMCDSNMQARLDVAKAMKEQLNQLKNKVVDCKCKVPIDQCVEVKRTPSLAAICQCSPEDRLVSPCSCTSLRTSLLSTMLCDMFGGLQSELGPAGAEMPCQLLKCLEDKHNWDRSSAVVTNLNHFFSKLLLVELDIAIANSIEKYHAKWVGASCVDDLTELIEPNRSEGWQKRAIEREAQKLATQMADKMFEEKAKELAERAKTIASDKEAPPCECQPNEKPVEQALYSVMVKPPKMSQVAGASSRTNLKNAPNEVTSLRAEIESLKKEAIKREDLKIMEKEIAQIIQLVSSSDCDMLKDKELKNKKEGTNIKNNTDKPITRPTHSNNINNRITVPKKRLVDSSNRQKNDRIPNTTKGTKQSKRPEQSYAVNLCLCGPSSPKGKKKLPRNENSAENSIYKVEKIQWENEPLKDNSPENYSLKDEKIKWNKEPSKNEVGQTSSVKQAKPISNIPFQDTTNTLTKKPTEDTCRPNRDCFHKIPSNTSIDNLLKTLAKWQSEIATTNESNKKVSNQNNTSDHDTSVTEVDVIMQEIVGDETLSFSNCTSEDIKVGSDSKKSSFNEKDQDISQPTHDVVQDAFKKEISSKDSKHNECPTNTESEYMGAIYLDKSNENYCKCVVDCRKEESYPLKCIRSCSCPLKLLDGVKSHMKTDTLTYENKKHPLIEGPQKRIVVNNGQGSQNVLSRSLSKSTYIKNKDSMNIYTNIKDLISQSIQITHSTSSVNNEKKVKSSLFNMNATNPVNPDYDIEFLGVTLTDAFTKSSNENSNKKGKLSKVEYNSLAIPENNIKNYVENYADADQSKNIGIDNPDLLAVPTCECKSDMEDIKNLFSTIFTTKQDLKYDITDKCFDTQSLKGCCRNESCVCCSKIEKEKDIDLELNTFILLEEHLKKKLNELKLSCTASCIPTEEEEKVISSLFNKIRHLVISSTNEVMCKCADTNEIDDSWNRALNLLQEYLNTKINRVKCLCSSPKSSKRILVPEIMDKVCKLIENDFSRLKKICKCQNRSIPYSKKKIPEQVTFQLPEKETSIIKNEAVVHDNLLNITNSDDEYYDPSFTLTKHVSAQVSLCLDMINKSCLAMQKEIIFSEPLELNNTNMKESGEDINSDTCHCPDDYFVNDATSLIRDIKIHAGKDALDTKYAVNNDTNITYTGNMKGSVPIMKKEYAETGVIDNISPYIGYTVDCICGSHNLSDCVCSKSIVKKNNNAIDKIWKSVISKPIKQNTSYIMKSSKKIDELEVIKIKDVSDFSFQNDSDIHFCDLNTSADIFSDLVLKISTENLNKTPNDNSTNTAMVNLSLIDAIYKEPSEVATLTKQNNDNNVDVIVDVKAFKSEEIANFNNNCLTRPSPQYCKCTKVPICHVKMLMDNIEDKLSRSSCTCDSLNINVCPVHSFRSNVAK